MEAPEPQDEGCDHDGGGGAGELRLGKEAAASASPTGRRRRPLLPTQPALTFVGPHDHA